MRHVDATGPVIRIGGILTALVMLATVAHAFTGRAELAFAAGVLAIAAVGCFSFGVSKARLIFVVIGVVQVAWALSLRPDGAQAVATAIGRGGFIMALFTALAAIRTAAAGSAGIIECGRFLARQPPGRRYVALTAGGHLFGLVLMYGSISLLGSLAVESTQSLADAELRRHRLRRMLIAIQRGFAATLCWSPLAFSMVLATTLVPGASWSAAVLPCLVSAALIMGVGWGLDTIFKPRLATPTPARLPESGAWLGHLRPLLVLLAVVASAVGLVTGATGAGVVASVMLIVPATAILWIALQMRQTGSGWLGATAGRIGGFVTTELVRFRAEVLLLFMAAFIGHLGAYLLLPILQRSAVDLSVLPAPAVLAAMVWLIPMAGQIGMNPILAVSLFVPLLPSPASLGVEPVAMVVAITGGWAISGTTSPFTASVMLVGALSDQSPRQAGLRWNGAYALVMGTLLSAWAIVVGMI